MHHLVTIAIPFYNSSNYLKYAIYSIINQTYTNWELLLIDDGSTDNSLEIANSFKDDRISVYSDGVNRGLIYRLNQSVNLAKGTYYARMDADDIMHPERIERQVNYLIEHPDIDVLGTSYFSIDNNNKIIRQIDINGKLNRSNIRFLHPSAIAKRKWFIDNPYESSCIRMEDYELWLRTSPKYNIYTLQEPLMFYREFGLPTWKKYILTQVGILKLYIKYKKYNIPFTRATKKSIITIAKMMICSICYLTHRMDLIVNMRQVNKKKAPIVANRILNNAITCKRCD